jgi:hypothetical protein
MHVNELRQIADDRIAEGLERASRHRRRAEARAPRRRGIKPWLVAAGNALRRCLIAVARRVEHALRREVEALELLYDADHPWTREGPLRWDGGTSTARLLGSHLPNPPGEVAPGGGPSLQGRPEGIGRRRLPEGDGAHVCCTE